MLPLVSRRRHEAFVRSLRRQLSVTREQRDEFRRLRNACQNAWLEQRNRARDAEARVAELERAIEEHRSRAPAPPDEDLWAVLDGHDLCEDPTCPAVDSNPHRAGHCVQARAHLEADGG